MNISSTPSSFFSGGSSVSAGSSLSSQASAVGASADSIQGLLKQHEEQRRRLMQELGVIFA